MKTAFFILTTALTLLLSASDAFAVEQNWARPTDCRENIAQVLCEVAPITEPNGQYTLLDRQCSGSEEKYLPALLEIYDDLDPINQKMFCSLRPIFIERE